VRLRGRLHVSLGGNFELLLGSDEQAAVSIARNVALTNPGAGRFRLAQGELVLAPGSYAFEVAYSDKHDTAHLVVDLYRAADAISRERPVVPAPSSQPAMPAGAPPARSMSGHASVPP
jgi:hypothetical protein